MNTICKIGTHDGVFHADEVLACTMLRYIHINVEIVRTRNPEILKKMDYLVDVGGVYDPDTDKFDHHQVDDNLPIYPNGIKYSSFGLVYKKYGKDMIQKWLKFVEVSDLSYALDFVYNKILEYIVKPVDDWDNGGKECPPISSIISSLNLPWYENNEVNYDQFFNAMEVAGKYLYSRFKYFVGEYLSLEMASSIERKIGGIMILPTFFPWQSYAGKDDIFCIYQALSGKWNINAIPTEPGGRTLKKSLPSEWLENPPEECTFVHKALFIAAFNTKEAAIKAAQSIE